MKNYLFIGLLLSSLQLFAQSGYWCGSKFISLYPQKDSLYFVKTKTSNNYQKGDVILLTSSNKVMIENVVSPNQLIIKSPTSIKDSNNYISPQYSNPTKIGSVYILPQILVSVNCIETLNNILTDFNGVLSINDSIGIVYNLDCDVLSSDEVFSLASTIREMDGVNWCEPNKMQEILYYSDTNPYYDEQYYIENISPVGYDINAPTAWSIVNVNSNLKVAVIDTGVEEAHEDLSGCVLDGFTYDDPYSFGNPYTNEHGTCCAGIIAAIDNDKGIKGVASGVKILPVGMQNINLGYYLDDYKVASCINWAVSQNADILSCSWGLWYESETIENALSNALTNGRAGKGCVVVFASGNYYSTNYNPGVSYPAESFGIAVGAVDSVGVVCPYSQRGSSLSLVAISNRILQYGSIYTTTLTGDGFGGGNYTNAFGGTSAACPQVAGVAALMLSANPNLTQSQVKHILQCTAKKLPNMYGQNRTDAYGYGLVDAYAAVKVAQYWQNCSNCTLSGSSTVCSNETYSISGVPSNATVSWRFEGQTSSSPTIVPNSSNYTCSVSPGYSSFKGYLCADVKIQGYTIETYKKLIEGGNGFIGYYWDDTVYMDVLWSDDNWVTEGHLISVHSEDLAGKTAKISRSSAPSNYTNLSILGTSPEIRVEFYMPYLSSGEYLTLWITGICGENSFVFRAASNRNSSNPLSVSEQGERRYLLSLNRQNDEKLKGRGGAICNSNDDYWVFRVYNATNLQQVASELVKGNQFLLDASSWKAGFYIIRAYIDEKPYIVKISVK